MVKNKSSMKVKTIKRPNERSKSVRRKVKHRDKYKRKPSEQRKIALMRIIKLFKLADKVVEEYKNNDINFGKKLANRYIEIARKISMKYKVRIPPESKRRFCKKCHSFLIPGINLRVRIQGKKVVYTCLECGSIMRYPYFKEIKEKRKKKLKTRTKTKD